MRVLIQDQERYFLEPVSDENASAAAETFKNLHTKLKMMPKIFRTRAHAPDVLDVTLALSATDQSGLVDELGVDCEGCLDPNELEDRIRDATILVSLIPAIIRSVVAGGTGPTALSGG